MGVAVRFERYNGSVCLHSASCDKTCVFEGGIFVLYAGAPIVDDSAVCIDAMLDVLTLSHIDFATRLPPAGDDVDTAVGSPTLLPSSVSLNGVPIGKSKINPSLCKMPAQTSRCFVVGQS